MKTKLFTLIALLSLVICTATFADEMKKILPKEMSIVETAVSNKDFSTLVTALKAADLVKTLEGEGPFTVFAPTNEAFAKIPKEQLEALLKDKLALTNVLLYHVVAGKVMAADAIMLDGKSNGMVNGTSALITVKEGKVMVDNSTVIAADIKCSNGVIHVIDNVMMPKASTKVKDSATPSK